jgi:hypothetical protein
VIRNDLVLDDPQDNLPSAPSLTAEKGARKVASAKRRYKIYIEVSTKSQP